MPIFEYRCERHGLKEELLILPGEIEPPAPPCPWCGQPMQKIMSAPSFHLKGRGWAKDGYENPLKGDDLQNVTGEEFRNEYRKQLADPDHPRQVGDILKGMGRKGDDLSDL